jgi:drug/metabolite transporter (DMT)-like permease
MLEHQKLQQQGSPMGDLEGQKLPDLQQQHQQRQPVSSSSRWQRIRTAAKAVTLAILIGTILNMSAVGSAGAAKLVNAYVVQLLLLLTPLVCALFDLLLLRQRSPPLLLPAVLLSLVGGGMVVAGYWLQQQAASSGSSSSSSRVAAAAQAREVVLGVVVALLSMLGLAVYAVLVQLTRKTLTAQQVGRLMVPLGVWCKDAGGGA